MKKLFCFLVMVFFFFSSIPPGDADMTRQLKGGYTKAQVDALLAAYCLDTLNISFVQNGMIATDDFLFGPPFTQACTVTGYGGVLHSGTNIIGRLYICNATTDITNPMDIAANCDACDSADITFDGGNDDREAAPDGVVAVGVGYRLAFVINTVSAPGFFTFDVNLTVD